VEGLPPEHDNPEQQSEGEPQESPTPGHETGCGVTGAYVGGEVGLLVGASVGSEVEGLEVMGLFDGLDVETTSSCSGHPAMPVEYTPPK